MAGVFGLRNIAAAAGLDPRDVIALVRSGDTKWLTSRVLASWERQCFEEQPSLAERRSGELETTTAAAKALDVEPFLRSIEIQP